MNVDELRQFLKILAAYDGRNVGQADVAVWGRQLADVEAVDAFEAVHQHYGETTDWVRPADIRQRARKLYNHRNRRPEVVAPGCYEPDEDARRRLKPSDDGERVLPAAVPDQPTTDRTAEAKALFAELAEKLGMPDPNVLRRREWVDNPHPRAADAPNPHFRGLPPPGGWPIPGEGEAA